jgi:hypothetical protein
MLKTIIIVLISLVLFSCNKENSTRQRTESPKTDTQNEESDSDTAMTAEESFSSALVEDIMGENDDVDLQYYLEEQIYPLITKSDKITIDRISSSLYLLSYNENGAMKNFLLQKFYNPVKDEIVFEKSETQSNTLKQFVK